MSGELKPLDPIAEIEEEITYTVIATHHPTRQIATATADTAEVAVAEAKNNLLQQLEIIGG